MKGKLTMKIDNHELLMKTVKMCMAQENVKESAPFVISVKESKDGDHASTAFNGTGGDIINLMGNLMESWIKTLKDSGANYEIAESMAMKLTMKALERNYGLGTMVGHAIDSLKKTLADASNQDDDSDQNEELSWEETE